MKEFVYEIQEGDADFKRLDKLLSEKFEQFSRSYLKHLYSAGLILIKSSGEPIDDFKKIPNIGESIIIRDNMEKPDIFVAENIPLNILFEDEHIIVIDKPAGMVVHPAAGNWSGTLVNAILHHCPDIEGIGDAKRPGIVHRLDKGTSGVMMVAKSHQAHEKLSKMFLTHDLDRKYLALIYGEPRFVRKTIESYIRRHPNNRKKMQSHKAEGKKAITHLRVVEKFERAALIECTLETGRTHQIRVHLSQECHLPIINDTTYSRLNERKAFPETIVEKIKQDDYPFLHAQHLGFKHPITNEPLSFNSPLPEKFETVLSLIKHD